MQLFWTVDGECTRSDCGAVTWKSVFWKPSSILKDKESSIYDQHIRPYNIIQLACI